VHRTHRRFRPNGFSGGAQNRPCMLLSEEPIRLKGHHQPGMYWKHLGQRKLHDSLLQGGVPKPTEAANLLVVFVLR